MPSFFRRKASAPPLTPGLLGRLDASGEVWANAPPPPPPGPWEMPPALTAQSQSQFHSQYQPRSPSPSLASVRSHVRPSTGGSASRRPSAPAHPPSASASAHPPRTRARRPSLRRRDSNGSIRELVQDVGAFAREGIASVRRASIDLRRGDANAPDNSRSHLHLASSSSTSVHHLSPASRHPLASLGRAAKSATDIHSASRFYSRDSPNAPPLPANAPRSPSLYSRTNAAAPPSARRTFQQTARTSMESLRKLGRKASLGRHIDSAPPHQIGTSAYAPSHASASIRAPSVRGPDAEEDWGDPFSADPQPLSQKTTIAPMHPGASQHSAAAPPLQHAYAPSQHSVQAQSSWRSNSRSSTATSQSSSRVLSHGNGSSRGAVSSTGPTPAPCPKPSDRESTRSSSSRLLPLSVSRASNGAPAPPSAAQPLGHAHNKSHGSSSVLSRSASGAASLASSHSTSATTMAGGMSPRTGKPSSARKPLPALDPVYPAWPMSSRQRERELPPSASPTHASAPSVPLAPAASDAYASPAHLAREEILPTPAAPPPPPPRRNVGLGISGVDMDDTVAPSPQKAEQALLTGSGPARLGHCELPQLALPNQPAAARTRPHPPPPAEFKAHVHPPQPEQEPVSAPVSSSHSQESHDDPERDSEEPLEEPRLPMTPAAPPQLTLEGLDFGSDLGSSLGLGLDDWSPSWEQFTRQEPAPTSTSPSKCTQNLASAPTAASQKQPQSAPSEAASVSDAREGDEESSAALEGLMDALVNEALDSESDGDSLKSEAVIHTVTSRATRTEDEAGLGSIAGSGRGESDANPSPTTVRAYSPPTPAARRSSSMRRGTRASARWSVGSGARRKKTPGVDLDVVHYPLPSPSPGALAAPPVSAASEGFGSSAASTVLGDPIDPSNLPHDVQPLAPYLSSHRAAELYTNLSIIGEGECGDVYCADVLHRAGTQVAIKMVRRDTDAGQARLSHLVSELALWRQVSSPYVVKLHCTIFTPTVATPGEGDLWLVQELMDRSVADVLAAVIEPAPAVDLNWGEAHMARILSDAAAGLAHLHASGIVHRDCRSDNLLMGADGVTKLTDLTHAASLAASPSGKRRSVVGTPFWMAPEVIRGHAYGTEVDLWSLGAVLYELAEGAPAYIDLSPREAVSALAQRGLPPLVSRRSPALRALFAALAQMDPARRPAASDIPHDPFCAPAAAAHPLDMARLLRDVHAIERGQL